MTCITLPTVQYHAWYLKYFLLYYWPSQLGQSQPLYCSQLQYLPPVASQLQLALFAGYQLVVRAGSHCSAEGLNLFYSKSTVSYCNVLYTPLLCLRFFGANSGYHSLEQLLPTSSSQTFTALLYCPGDESTLRPRIALDSVSSIYTDRVKFLNKILLRHCRVTSCDMGSQWCSSETRSHEKYSIYCRWPSRIVPSNKLALASFAARLLCCIYCGTGSSGGVLRQDS